MINGKFSIENLDQHLGAWLQDANGVKDALTQYSDFMLDEVSKGRSDLESSYLQVRQQLLDLEYKVLVIGLLMDIRIYTANSAYELATGINVQGDVDARIVG